MSALPTKSYTRGADIAVKRGGETVWTHHRVTGDLGVRMLQARGRGHWGLGDASRFLLVGLAVDGEPPVNEVWTDEQTDSVTVRTAIQHLKVVARELEQIEARNRAAEGAT